MWRDKVCSPPSYFVVPTLLTIFLLHLELLHFYPLLYVFVCFRPFAGQFGRASGSAGMTGRYIYVFWSTPTAYVTSGADAKNKNKTIISQSPGEGCHVSE
jgi:hypothetical protein